MKKRFHFLCGLPRTGSTVIESILNQNPEVFVTPTSPLLHLLNSTQYEFQKCPEVVANPFPVMLENMSRAIIDSIWGHRPEPIIIDKHRGWGKNMHSATKIFGEEIRVIATVRDLPSIMASWLTLIRKQPNNFIKDQVIQKGFEPTEDNMMAEMWYGYVLDTVESLCTAKETVSDRLLLINYDDFVNDPEKQISNIESFLDLPTWKYDFRNILNNNENNDLETFGFAELHTIRPTISKISIDPKEVLGESLFNRFIALGEQYDL